MISIILFIDLCTCEQDATKVTSDQVKQSELSEASHELCKSKKDVMSLRGMHFLGPYMVTYGLLVTTTTMIYDDIDLHLVSLMLVVSHVYNIWQLNIKNRFSR